MGISIRRGWRSAVRKPSFWRRSMLVLLAFVFAAGLLWQPGGNSRAAPALSIIPTTWNILGLHTNAQEGPNTFPVGARVCNTGTDPATDVEITLVWESDSTFITASGPISKTLDTLPTGDCTDALFTVVVTRTDEARDKSRAFHITASAEGVASVSTPTPRELYVVTLSPSAELKTLSISGPANVTVGQVYDYVARSSTSPLPFQQVESFLNLPPDAFRVEAITTTYTISETNAITDTNQLYIDACDWRNDPTITSTYRTCADPTGIVSGTLVTTYTVEILSAGTFNLYNTLLGYRNNTYFYNSNFQQAPLVVTASATEADLFIVIVMNNWPQGTPGTPTATATGTQQTQLATPTATGTITPVPGVTKSVSPSEVRIGQTATFNIRIVNTGAAPATNVRLVDNLTTYSYLDISNLTTTKGTRDVTGRTGTVNVGTLMPNESVTISLAIRVNSNATAGTYNPCNIAQLTYSTALSTSNTRNSNQQCFRVVGGSSLPGTGHISLQEAAVLSLWPYAAGLLLLCALAALILHLALVSRQKSPGPWVLGASILFSLSAGVLVIVSLVQNGPPDHLTRSPAAVLSSPAAPVPSQTPSPSATINPLAVMPAYLFATPVPRETLPAYVIPTPLIQSTQEPGESGPDTSPIVRIVLPSINEDRQVAYIPYDGDTWLIRGLNQEVAWMGDTSWPGLGGNTGLAGHITVRGVGNGPFRYLDRIKPGDQILIYTERYLYTYNVREQRVVEEGDLSVIDQTENPQVTLITCVDWDENMEIYTRRLAVIGDQIKVEPLAYSLNY